MKLSYIMSIILSVIMFCLTYIWLDLGILFSLITSVIAYFAFTMVFKSKEELQVEINSPLNEYDKLTSSATKNINEIFKYSKLIQNKNITDNISVICDLSDKILNSVKKSPKKLEQVRKFINYYLPFTLDILKQYDNIEDLRLTSSKSKEFMKKVEILIDRVKDACQNQLNALYDGEMINTNADIKVFENMLKSDGLVDSNMNISLNRKGR